MNEFLKILVELGLVSGVSLAIIKFWFDKRLEKTKSRLKQIEISESYKYQMRLANFNDLNLEKFNAIKLLHNKLAIAGGKFSLVLYGAGFQVLPNYSKYNKIEMTDYLKSLKATQSDINQICQSLEEDPEKVNNLVSGCISSLNSSEALHALADSRNHFFSHRLYIDNPEIEKEIKAILDALNKVSAYIKIPARIEEAKEFRKTRDECFHKFEESMEKLVSLIRKQFSAENLERS